MVSQASRNISTCGVGLKETLLGPTSDGSLSPPHPTATGAPTQASHRFRLPVHSHLQAFVPTVLPPGCPFLPPLVQIHLLQALLACPAWLGWSPRSPRVCVFTSMDTSPHPFFLLIQAGSAEHLLCAGQVLGLAVHSSSHAHQKGLRAGPAACLCLTPGLERAQGTGLVVCSLTFHSTESYAMLRSSMCKGGHRAQHRAK